MGDGDGDTVLTNLGPLPTNFAVDSNCAGDFDDVYKYYTTSTNWYFLLQGPVEQTSCYPSGYTANSKQYYSPARCPTGFTSACVSHNVAGTVEETVVRCCPTQSNFVCQTAITFSWEKTLGCTNPQGPQTVWTVSQVSDGLTALSTYTAAIGGVNAYQIQVGYQSTDFASSTSTSSKTTKSSTKSQTLPTTQSTATRALSGSSSNPGSSSHTKHKSEISSGATAGIVVGALAGLLLVVALVMLAVRNRRRQQAGTVKRENAVELDAGETRQGTNSRGWS